MEDEITEITEESSVFMKLMPVIDISFLDTNVVGNALFYSGYDEDDDLLSDQYFEWHMGWNGNEFAKALNIALLAKQVPENSVILLKMY
jgi:hypothetical protein